MPANATNFTTDMTCPNGKLVLGAAPNPTYPTVTFSSHPTGNSTWEFRNVNPNGGAATLENLYIICANAST